LRAVGRKFEVVIFTASLAKYADPLLDILDPERIISARLFRESCHFHYGNYVKDLSHLGRPIEHTLIIDNSPLSYLFQPENAVPCESWFQDKSDLQLYELLPFLDLIADCADVVPTIAEGKAQCRYTFFGNAAVPPQIVIPWEPQPQQQQTNELIQVSVGS
jgi:RNA polymerase II subunit A small phosphatase-like protein